MTEHDKMILSEALTHYAHAAAYFNPQLAAQAEELRKKLCDEY
jgi:hypothetical protein